MSEKTITPHTDHKVAYQDIVALMTKHATKVQADELLAIAANVLGKLIAHQDQRKHTQATIMEIISRNIEIGNQEALAALHDTKGSA